MKLLLIILGALAAIVLVVVVIGYALPVAHRATGSALVQAPPGRVFEVLTRVDEYPRWRRSVERVEIAARDLGGAVTRFREHGSDGTILFEVVERDAPRRLVTRIADPGLPFGGRWTFELAPAGDATRVTIVEDGEVYNPLFRFVSRFIMGHTRTIDTYLEDLAGARY